MRKCQPATHFKKGKVIVLTQRAVLRAPRDSLCPSLAQGYAMLDVALTQDASYCFSFK